LAVGGPALSSGFSDPIHGVDKEGMMSDERFSSLRKLAEATLEKYEKADSLAKYATENRTGCFYSHKVNQVGCAIGCHFTPDEADKLDDIGGSVWSIYHQTEGGGKEILERRFLIRPAPRYGATETFNLIGVQDDPAGISIEELRYFQIMHDRSEDVQDYRNRLRFFLKTGNIVASTGRFIHEENIE
jgi:hypothetical protein